ncbi:hypothetical protein DY000_02042713 [Brassica cretica]|uniref:Uncharacterized protein n=1 Tax=Brassica cretica TaxID=69181 RepID=A0ABQ7BCB0_BRACR|nr:hypothetical protein DY000_02042713 [Brassica cretica]
MEFGDGRVVSEKTWEGARFRRTPFDFVALFTTTTVTSFSLSVLILFFFVGRAGGREQRRQYTVVPRAGMSLVKICVGFTSSPPPHWCDIAATPVKRDAAVVQAGGGVVVVRWRCGGD